MGCYSFGSLARPVSLAKLGGPGPVGPTGDDSQERLLGGGVSIGLLKILADYY